MSRFYSRSTGGTYIAGVHTDIPSDALPISEEVFLNVFSRPRHDKVLGHNQLGIPMLIDRTIEQPTAEELCADIDRAADIARQTAAGDPLRALEYDKALSEAEVFKANGYPVTGVPETVSAWAVEGRSPEQAALEIISKAEAFNSQLLSIRTIRLRAKESVRKLIAEEKVDAAKITAQVAINELQTFVAAIDQRKD